MTRESCHLMTMLPEVPDPRNNKGKRHPLESILALLVLLFLGELLAVYEIVEKAHGRLETRCVIGSTSLAQYLDWPGIAQVIQYHYIIKNTRTGEEKHTIHLWCYSTSHGCHAEYSIIGIPFFGDYAYS